MLPLTWCACYFPKIIILRFKVISEKIRKTPVNTEKTFSMYYNAKSGWRCRAPEFWECGVQSYRDTEVRTCCKKGEGDNVASAYVLHLRQSTSLGHPWVETGLSVGNPQVMQPTALYFSMTQVSTGLGSLSAEAGTHHKYLPHLSISWLNLAIPNPRNRR
jgi:hypothetical protein